MTSRSADAPIAGAVRQRRPPKTMRPQLATAVADVPSGERWLHEIKHDGYRILARVEGGEVRLYTRKQKDWTDRFPSVARVLRELPVSSAWLDGEAVVLDARGRSDFGRLQHALGPGRDRDVRYVVFDLLHLDGWDLRPAPLVERKERLRRLLDDAGAPTELRFSEHIVGRGAELLEHARAVGAEGVVSKRADRPYVGERTRDWRKVKCLGREDLLVGGWTDPRGRREGIGALLLGERADGELRYRGKVGTGFDARTLRALRERLEPLSTDEPPFADPPRMRGVHWVRPGLVVEVAYAERTRDGRLRHPSFNGVREDLSEDAPRGPALRLTNLDRVYYPGIGLTKRELARYWLEVAERALPHIARRPLVLLRCPEGIEGERFFQKHVYAGMPPQLVPVRVVERREAAPYAMIRDASGLVALAQVGALEVHVWGARVDDLEHPDRLVFDLDPGPGVSWKRLVEAAREIRELLGRLRLASFVEATGGKGLHVVVPVAPVAGWREAKRFCQAVARTLEREAPARYTASPSKSERARRIYVDYLRNARGATAVAPYSPRAKPGAPVATPLRWDELDAWPSSDAVGVRDVPGRLRAAHDDPWEGFFELDQRVPEL